MSKRVIAIALAVVCGVFCAVFSACNDGEGQSSDKHVHRYSDFWYKDETHHWHSCKIDQCDEKSGYAEHSYVDGYCECGKSKPCAWSEEWESNNLNHWHACTDTGCNLRNGLAEHVYTDNYCVCGRKQSGNTSVGGFVFELNEEESGYNLTGISDTLTNTVTIPSEYNGKPVTGIENRAFVNCNNITSVIIPNSVTHIYKNAFYGCKALTSIIIPDSVNYVGDFVYGCDNLRFNEYDNGLYLGNGDNPYLVLISAVSGDNTSFTVNENTQLIVPCAFENCEFLTDIVLYDSIKSIDMETMEFILQADLNYNVYDNACYLGNENNPYVALITTVSTDITACTVHSDTKIIAPCAFLRCEALENVVIPQGVTSIGEGAFFECKALTSVNIPEGVTEISIGTFYYCWSLSSISIPEGVTRIGESAFWWTHLNYVNLPASLTFIGKNGISLETDGVLYYGGDLSGWCNIKREVEYDSIISINGKQLFISGEELTGEIVIPEGITEIELCAFQNCDKITKVRLPESITKIAYGAFENCTALEEINLPEGLVNIGGRAFRGCTKLKSIDVPSTVSSLSEATFENCTSLAEVLINGPTLFTEYTFEGCNIKYNEYDNAIYLGNKSNPYMVLLKAKNNEITDCNINSQTKAICGGAFYRCESLYTVNIPDGVTRIGSGAFQECKSLLKVVVPIGVQTIPRGMFINCEKLSTVVLPYTVTDISMVAFGYCENLHFIEFGGTKAEWESVEKSVQWEYASGITGIRCRDGVMIV